MKANKAAMMNRWALSAGLLLIAYALVAYTPPAITAATAPRATFAELLVAVVAVLGGVLYGWLVLGAALSALAVGSSRLAATAHLASRVLVPAWWRRTVCWALSGAVVALPATAAGANELPNGHLLAALHSVADRRLPAADDNADAPGLSGLPFPDRPGGHVARRQPVVVASGDTLWSIASAHLDARPSDAAIAAAWPAWHQANRQVIGPDPDLIVPGTPLRRPR